MFANFPSNITGTELLDRIFQLASLVGLLATIAGTLQLTGHSVTD